MSQNNTNTFKKDLFSLLAVVGKSLGNGNRLELMELLAQGERTVMDLAKTSNISVTNTSQHLQGLKRAGLVKTRIDGLKTYYRISDSSILELIILIREIAENNLAEIKQLTDTYLFISDSSILELIILIREIAENNLAEIKQLTDTYLFTKDDLEPITRDDLLKKVRKGLVTIIDVRPEEEFNSGHLPKAINMPLINLKKGLKELPRNKEIVAYCRGPYCILAFEAVDQLRAKGFKARRLEGGYPEWKLGGLPIEESA